MTDLHQVGVTAPDQASIEKVDPRFIIEGLLKARDKTIEVLKVICSELKEGQSENDAKSMAQNIFADYGVIKHWHRPYIRFGEGSVLTFHDPISENRLKPKAHILSKFTTWLNKIKKQSAVPINWESSTLFRNLPWGGAFLQIDRKKRGEAVASPKGILSGWIGLFFRRAKREFYDFTHKLSS